MPLRLLWPKCDQSKLKAESESDDIFGYYRWSGSLFHICLPHLFRPSPPRFSDGGQTKSGKYLFVHTDVLWFVIVYRRSDQFMSWQEFQLPVIDFHKTTSKMFRCSWFINIISNDFYLMLVPCTIHDKSLIRINSPIKCSALTISLATQD